MAIGGANSTMRSGVICPNSWFPRFKVPHVPQSLRIRGLPGNLKVPHRECVGNIQIRRNPK